MKFKISLTKLLVSNMPFKYSYADGSLRGSLSLICIWVHLCYLNCNINLFAEVDKHHLSFYSGLNVLRQGKFSPCLQYHGWLIVCLICVIWGNIFPPMALHSSAPTHHINYFHCPARTNVIFRSIIVFPILTALCNRVKIHVNAAYSNWKSILICTKFSRI